jgi:hypothetical protein
MFAVREPNALRGRLAALEADLRLQKLSFDAFNDQAFEILEALSKLGEEVRKGYWRCPGCS